MFDRNKPLIRELFERNERSLLSYLTRKVGRDAAPDLLQDAFVRVLRHGQLEAIADPTAFLKQIAINLTRDFARRRKVEANYLVFNVDPADAPSTDAQPDGRLEADDEARLLRQVLETLPPRRREVLTLHLHENLPLSEIARRLQISDRMVHKHLSLALRSCRAALREPSR